MHLPLPQDRRRRRAGFTMVELLIVLGIILILMSLLVAAVSRVGAVGKRTSNMNDIQQLNAAVVNFMQQFNVKYLPSRIYLSEDLTQYGNAAATAVYNGNPYTVPAQLRVDSQAFLNRMFPKLFQSTTAVDWNGNGSTSDPGVILEGDQCLVFFLGGIPAAGTPGTTGFSTNPRNPAWHIANSGNVIAPFYEFKSGRLADRSGQGFYSYLDAYAKMPYLYFSSYGNLNGYNPYAAQTFQPSGGSGTAITNSSDCNTFQVWPYAEAQQPTGAYRYLKPTGFQIVSAGADSQFASGTSPTASPVLFWNDSQGFFPFKPDVGQDDQTNFSGATLGSAGS